MHWRPDTLCPHLDHTATITMLSECPLSPVPSRRLLRTPQLRIHFVSLSTPESPCDTVQVALPS